MKRNYICIALLLFFHSLHFEIESKLTYFLSHNAYIFPQNFALTTTSPTNSTLCHKGQDLWVGQSAEVTVIHPAFFTRIVLKRPQHEIFVCTMIFTMLRFIQHKI